MLRMRATHLRLLIPALLLTGSLRAQQPDGPVAWWKFDEGRGSQAYDSADGLNDAILNNFDWAKGVDGGGLSFDGFTTVVERSAQQAPRLRGAFTIEAWVALQSYPWNWVALADQEKDRQAGYYFGIDAEGRLGLQLEVWGVWEVCRSGIRIPLARWTHVAAVYDPESGIHLYIDGKSAGDLPVSGDFTPAPDTPLWIGRNLRDLPPVALVRPNVAYPAKYSLDGILDDLQIYDRSLSAPQIAASFQPSLSAAPPDFAPRLWPRLPPQAAHLGAAYTSLSLYPQWDRLWRTGPGSDVVVSFGKLPVHYVFWRGANYGPNIVTENGIWMSDQSFESHTQVSTAEHMNDKHDLHASISIIENTPARVVLRWRYALVDVLGNFADVDPDTGWGDWADEDFYIYPDGVAVRHGTMHGTKWKYSFTEPTLMLEPGRKPEDYISLQAATVANSAGESQTYSWDPVSPPFPFPNQPADANIALINLKSRFKPFYIYHPGTVLGPYGWPPELRPRYSHFPVWNHWPVNQIPSDGRFALFPDHYASAAIMSPNPNATWIDGPGPTKTTYFLFGLTDGAISGLVRLDRSWLHPPAVRVSGTGSAVYDPGQKAYLVQPETNRRSGTEDLTLSLQASAASPLVNPAFVITGWGSSRPRVLLNGAPLSQDKYREGYRSTLQGTDLIFWLDGAFEQPVKISLVSARRQQPGQ
jgi:hypothetical protein